MINGVCKLKNYAKLKMNSSQSNILKRLQAKLKTLLTFKPSLRRFFFLPLNFLAAAVEGVEVAGTKHKDFWEMCLPGLLTYFIIRTQKGV